MTASTALWHKATLCELLTCAYMMQAYEFVDTLIMILKKNNRYPSSHLHPCVSVNYVSYVPMKSQHIITCNMFFIVCTYTAACSLHCCEKTSVLGGRAQFSGYVWTQVCVPVQANLVPACVSPRHYILPSMVRGHEVCPRWRCLVLLLLEFQHSCADVRLLLLCGLWRKVERVQASHNALADDPISSLYLSGHIDSHQELLQAENICRAADFPVCSVLCTLL
jgi:hypothetical protein